MLCVKLFEGKIMKTMESLNLTPAESLMIRDPEGCNVKEMMKFTLIDLLLKKVFKAEVRQESTGYILESTVNNTHISEGEYFSKIKLKPHEDVFTRIKLFSQGSLKLSIFAKELYRSVHFSFSKYKKNFVREPLFADGYFQKETKKFLFIFPYSKYILSEKGRITQTKIKKLLEEGENLEKWVKNEPAHAKAYLSICGANILLLKKYDLKVIKEWTTALSKIESQENFSDYYEYSWDALSLNVLADIIEIDNFDSDFDSGLQYGYFDKVNHP